MLPVKDIRAFLAIEPPEDVLQTMIRLQEKLKRELGGRISWTKPQGQHLTLKFFGDISLEDVQQISTAVHDRAASGWSLNLKIERLGVFPDPRRPRVLWCGMAGDVEKLSALQKQLDSDFVGIGFPGDDRPFRAHLTLGRIKDSRSVTGLGDVLAKYKTVQIGEFTGRELVLFQSKLTPQGAVYTKLAVYPLEGS